MYVPLRNSKGYNSSQNEALVKIQKTDPRNKRSGGQNRIRTGNSAQAYMLNLKYIIALKISK
jgi:hypothetical protein